MVESTFVLKLSDNADILKELENLAVEKQIEYGLIVSASGNVKDAELVSMGNFEGKQKLNGICEVDSISGKVQKVRGKFETNLRVSVSSTGFTSISGRLLKGKAAGHLEIGIRKVDVGKIIEA